MENPQKPVSQDEGDLESQSESQCQDKSGDISDAVNREGSSDAGGSTDSVESRKLCYWRWYRVVALLVGIALVVAAVVVVMTVLLDGEDSDGDNDIKAWLSECEAILTFSAPGGPHSVMICPGAADAYMDSDDLGKLIDDFLSMNMDVEDEVSDLSAELFGDIDIPFEMVEKLFGSKDMLDLADMLEEWGGYDTDERKGHGFDKRRGSGRKSLPEFFKIPAPEFKSPIPDIPKGWTPRIPRGWKDPDTYGWKDSDGWTYRTKCSDSIPDRQSRSDTSKKCETWLWDGEGWRNADDGDVNSQSWSRDGGFQFDDDGFKFFFSPNANGFDSLLDLVKPDHAEETSPEQTGTSSHHQTRSLL